MASKALRETVTRYKDPDVLHELYHERGMTLREVADELGCSHATVSKYMDEHGIDKRNGKPHAIFNTEKRGYEYATGGSPKKVYIHRLVAVAEHGFDAVVDKHIHHKNHITWDNRIDNIEVLPIEDHNREHTYDSTKLSESDVREIRRLYNETTIPRNRIAEKFDISGTHVRDVGNGEYWESVK